MQKVIPWGNEFYFSLYEKGIELGPIPVRLAKYLSDAFENDVKYCNLVVE